MKKPELRLRDTPSERARKIAESKAARAAIDARFLEIQRITREWVATNPQGHTHACENKTSPLA